MRHLGHYKNITGSPIDIVLRFVTIVLMIESGSKPGNQNQLERELSVLDAAANVVNMFDQVNTNHAIENLGNRGTLLKDAVSELRKKLNSDNQKTALNSKQAGE